MLYQGSCHCQKVRFEVELPALRKALACNCSICSKRGSLLTFIEGDSSFKIHSGSEALTSYRFGPKTIDHTFCSVCGILPFSSAKMPDGKQGRAVNVRCLDGLDADKLEVDYFDGRKL